MPLTPGTLVGPPEIDVLVPGEMREHYILIQRNTTITGRATYTRFRRSTVTTTEKPRPQ